jgi:gliding motility-associated protein GldM
MATGKLSIRQKMINMMYLVLLAILALNVSAEVLKAFYTMEVSLEKTGKNIDAKNNNVLKSFAVLMKNQPDKTEEWNKRALKGEKIEKEFALYIESLKKEIEKINGGREKDDDGKPTELKFGDNTEKHANLLLNNGKAKELKDKINATRDKLLALVPFEDRKHIKTDMFTLDDDEGRSWENHTFEGVPAAAVMASLTKIQNDCKNTYADVLNALYSKVGMVAPVDRLFANIVPKAKNVMVGEEFEADIMLSAYDSRQATEIVIDGKTYTNEGGKFNYKLPANMQGEHTVEGKIKVRERDGVKEYPFSTTYNVFNGSAAVSADKMNIMYVGLRNPISISIPGVPTDKLVATISSGRLNKIRDNQYEAVVPTDGDVYISIAERRDDGTLKSHGRRLFRAKKIPGAEPTLGALKKQLNSKSSYLAQSKLYASPKYDIGFAGVKYQVLSYQYIVSVRGQVYGPFTVQGNKIPSKFKQLIQQARKGDMIAFTNIKVRGPLGVVDKSFEMGYMVK